MTSVRCLMPAAVPQMTTCRTLARASTPPANYESSWHCCLGPSTVRFFLRTQSHSVCHGPHYIPRVCAHIAEAGGEPGAGERHYVDHCIWDSNTGPESESLTVDHCIWDSNTGRESESLTLYTLDSQWIFCPRLPCFLV